MKLCNGFENWFECLKCPHLCTKKCPIESDDAIEKMKIQMSFLSVSRDNQRQKGFWEIEP